MKNKKVLAALLVAAMTLGLTACGGNDSGSVNGTESGSKADGNYDQVTYAYCTFNNIPTEEDLDVVEDAINQITREKIGAEITLMPIAIADYSSKVSLALQGGEKIDIFESLGDFNNYVSTDMTYDLTDLLYQYGQEGHGVQPAAQYFDGGFRCVRSDGAFGQPLRADAGDQGTQKRRYARRRDRQNLESTRVSCQKDNGIL